MNEAEIQSRVLYRDGLMLVLDKPAGIACHEGPSKEKALEEDFKYLQYGLPRPPALAHRLDRDTSGCLVLGRHRKALMKLGKLFSQGKIEKKYWAVCNGIPEAKEGVINAPLLKVNTKRGWRIVIDPTGQESVTEYKVIAEKDGLCWIEASPLTGRTHQIRIHLKSIGAPIIGDPFYGKNSDDNGGEILHLHARSVSVPIYKNRDAVHVEAHPPEHMISKLKALGFAET